MEGSEILGQLNKIFIDIIDDEDIRLTNNTTANDVDGWDSLTHIQLVAAIEKHYKLRFTSKEILTWKNVGELIDSINNRIQA